MVPDFSDCLWGGCAALYGVHRAWRVTNYVIVQARRGACLRACRGPYQRLIARAVATCWHPGLMKMVLYGFAQHNYIDTALFCVLETTTVLRIVRGLARGYPYLAGGCHLLCYG